MSRPKGEMKIDDAIHGISTPVSYTHLIDRIPFPHPADPVLVTRKILEGPDMFFDIVLPRAKLLLKQAAGRLIRSKSDRGRVVILDGRVLSKRGWRITDALPGVKYRKVEVELGKKE